MQKNKESNWAMINKQLEALLASERDMIANMANAAALLYNNLNDVNWAGFYIFKNEELILGPFQGLPACVRISLGKGVCGNAALDRKVYLLDDVHTFPGHIACDQASNSEIVLPLVSNDRLIAVLDIDSPIKKRFDDIDRQGLEKFVDIFIKQTCFKNIF